MDVKMAKSNSNLVNLTNSDNFEHFFKNLKKKLSKILRGWSKAEKTVNEYIIYYRYF